MLDVVGEVDPVEVLPDEDVEVVGPEVRHDLGELAVRLGAAHDDELGKLQAEGPELPRLGRRPAQALLRAQHAVGRRLALDGPALHLDLAVTSEQVLG